MVPDKESMMKRKVPSIKGMKPNKKTGKESSGKVGTATKPVGKPRMRTGHAKAPYKVK
jgi:hypothetical protein